MSTALPGDQAKASVLVKVPPEEAFRVFTEEIDAWWRGGLRYRIGKRRSVVHLEPKLGGRLFESFDTANGDAKVKETGRVICFEPPRRLVLTWRAVNFAPDEQTEVEVLFEPSPSGTLVTVCHRGWSKIRPDHPARHGEDVRTFLRGMGRWWGDLMTSLREHAKTRQQRERIGRPWHYRRLPMDSVGAGVGDARVSGPEPGSRTNETLSWLAAASGFALQGERKVAALASVASVYADLCAPRGASQRQHDLVARFTLLFFLVDDASQGELPDLLASDAPWSIGRYTEALRVWLGEFSEREHAHPRLQQRFAHAYHDYLAARRAEHGQGALVLSLEEHWDFRRRTIFMEPYLDRWLLLLDVDWDALAEAPFAEARALAVDLVLLANDLASAERDAKGGASPDDLNLIHTYARVHAESEAATVERLVAHYNALVERYRAATARALAERPGPHAENYVEILTGVVDGNVASVRALGSRYPGSEAVMRRLLCCRDS